jgi:transcriptional regulator with XRE-family HTH domain
MGKLEIEDIILKKKIGERMKFLRLKTGLSQSEFAKKFDIDRQILNRWENEKNSRGVTIYTIHKFCNMIGITLAEFFDFE